MKLSSWLVSGLLAFSQVAFAVDQLNVLQWNKGKHAIQNDTNPWFEWWYYKVVIPETGKSYFFVYGVVNPWDIQQSKEASRSFIGFGDFENRQVMGEMFPVSAFKSSYSEVSTSIGQNTATDKKIHAGITDFMTGKEVSWDVTVDYRWAFNATSWVTGHNLTNIEWYPAQADARCSGTINNDGELVEFKDAPCYQDRNWGRSFPKWWTWIVSNEFENSPGTALAVGGGLPQVLGMVDLPMGVAAIGLKYKGEEITFRPNDFNPIFLDIAFGKWEVRAYNDKYKILISAKAAPEDFLDLQFMTPEGKIFHDYETLTGELEVKLFGKKGLGWEPVATLYSKYAGIEFGSDNAHNFSSLPYARIARYSSNSEFDAELK